MRYSFEAKFEKISEGYRIGVPFNIWEVSKHRDTIDAQLYIKEKMVECELFPLEKGKYEIRVEEDKLPDLDTSQPIEVLLRIPATLVKVDKESPYSKEHPIRRIDSVNVIIQPEDGLCGQACVAMLAGVTIAEVIETMGCREWQATMGRVISALNYYGIEHAGVIRFTGGKKEKLPKCCIMMEKMGRFAHYLIHYDGKFYDSNLGVLEEYEMSKLLGYLEVKV